MTSLSTTPAAKGLERLARPGLDGADAAGGRRLGGGAGVSCRASSAAGRSPSPFAALAVFGAFGILMYAFGLARFIGRASEFDLARAIAETGEEAFRRHLGRLERALRQRRPIAPCRARGRASCATSSGCSRARRRPRRRSIGSPRPRAPAGPASRSCGCRRRSPARARPPGIACACGRSTGRRKARRRCGRSATSPTNASATRRSSRICSTPSTFSTTRRPAFSRPRPTAPIAYMNATLANWLDYDIAEFTPGQMTLVRHRRRRRRGVAGRGRRRAGRGQDGRHGRRSQAAPRRLQTRAAHPSRDFRRRRRAGPFAHAGAGGGRRCAARRRRRSGRGALLAHVQRDAAAARARSAPTARCGAPTAPSPGSRRRR